MYVLKRNIKLSKESLRFLQECLSAINANFNLDNLDAMFNFNDNGMVIDMLCPYHNDHSFSLSNNSTSTSLTYNENFGLRCWVDGKIINFNTFLYNPPMLRTDKKEVHFKDEEAIKAMTLWYEIYSYLSKEYDSISKFINKAIEKNPSLAVHYRDLVYEAKEIYNPEEKMFIDFLTTLVIYQTDEQKEEVYKYFANRGFFDRSFIDKFQPFYLGKTVDEVKLNFFRALEAYENLNQKPLFSSKREMGEFAYSLALLSADNERNILENRIGLPIRNSYNDIVNYCLRLINNPTNDTKIPKYLYLPKQVKNNDFVNDILQFLDANNKHILGNITDRLNSLKSQEIFITEGLINAMALEYCGFDAGCSFGKDITENQIKYVDSLINQQNTVILAFDNDEAGLAGMEKTLKNYYLNKSKIKMLLLPNTTNNDNANDWNDIFKIYWKEVSELAQKDGISDRKGIVEWAKTHKNTILDYVYRNYKQIDWKSSFPLFLNMYIEYKCKTNHGIDLFELYYLNFLMCYHHLAYKTDTSTYYLNGILPKNLDNWSTSQLVDFYFDNNLKNYYAYSSFDDYTHDSNIVKVLSKSLKTFFKDDEIKIFEEVTSLRHRETLALSWLKLEKVRQLRKDTEIATKRKWYFNKENFKQKIQNEYDSNIGRYKIK